ncbi:hypothetical protein GOC91_10100 [Sinorhizobium medicae]|uniref:Uncharacterized protein n=1 Tax=Sinorhizobium medicae TaxID=110321 RepID=A0A6G1WMY4_9HYPH|nr:hypothetical protein [Sinorhizobium medicae]MDX0409896.1 hypothetical protein [Sinorhizobium medicae]MDX0416390.1 hypothetical protein [Sinorhizobium medicae]MDX0423373.1 hypothetical protein [Sinorhizobium medicae]MDX0428834.1 hypothetical protein [Sinorhizobium medicae]
MRRVPRRSESGVGLLASPYCMFSYNRIRLKNENMQQIKVLQRPLCVR